jgi:sugar lactone lactonase YvrE
LETARSVLNVLRPDRALGAGLVLLAGTLLCACGGTASAITPATRVSPTPAVTPTPSPSATPAPTTSTVPITQLLTLCPAPHAFSSLPRFASVAGARYVDVAPDGTVWVSTGSRGVIEHLTSTGAAMASYNEPSPTGVVALPNGDVLFADQGADRIVELNPATLATSTFLQLRPRAGQPNVEGLGIDPGNGLLVVPDSAEGQLLSVPLAGGGATVVAKGIAQPVGAAVGPGNIIEIASSASSGLLSVPQSGGTATAYKTVSLHLSTVVVSGLLVYFTAPPSKRVYAFNPATGHLAVLVTAIGNPVGLALLGNGQLVVSDATTGTLATFHSC